jgi:hypothetical protein
MQTQIKVTGLNLRQWDWLQDNVLIEYQFAPFDPRLCVEFELNEDIGTRHVEMPVSVFSVLMMVLHSLRLDSHAEAALVAMAYGTCDHCCRNLGPDGPGHAIGCPRAERDRANHPSRTGSPAASMARLTDEDDQDDMNSRPAGADQ